MKNLKVSMKLIISFLFVVALCAIVGIVGIVGMTALEKSSEEMYNKQTKPMPDIAKALEYIQRLRVELNNLALHTGEPEYLANVETYKANLENSFWNYTESYREAIPPGSNVEQLFNSAISIYNNEFKPGMNDILNAAKAGTDQATLIAMMDRTYNSSNQIVENLTLCMDEKINEASNTNKSNIQLYYTLLTLIIIVLIISIIASMILAFYVSGLISKPLIAISKFMKKAGTTGNITLSQEDSKTIDSYSQIKDEIGQCISGCATFVQHVINIADELESIAKGDLTTDIEILSEEDIMGQAVKHTVTNLNEMFSDINMASTQVSVGAGQVATGAHTLAQGSTEQAASVEQLSASVNEISETTKKNANMAGDAADMSSTIRTNAEKGSRQMDNMMKAVNEINEASQNINKIIKTIDDIAFQTNILALNAAVEAARAGQHGKGFAVVAEEVRNLASKSAQAAKDTSAMIESSVEKSNLGLTLATETAESLKEIVEGINNSTDIIQKIAKSSDEQTLAVSQINIGIDQVSQVIQQSSATAEQSAAASQEMSGQATLLSDLVKKFKLKKEQKIKL